MSKNFRELLAEKKKKTFFKGAIYICRMSVILLLYEKNTHSVVGSTSGEDVTIPRSPGVKQHNGSFSGT